MDTDPSRAPSTSSEETIAAISTPLGESGIGIVRISGPLSEPILKRIFKPTKETSSFISHRFYYGHIEDPKTGITLDEVLVVLMRAPKTYTREDVAEIHCHGGYLILQKVLELVIGEGARLAQPGEFTKRAFLNGRIDLTQAEAVIDLIKAKTAEGIEIANQQLKGTLFREVCNLREKLLNFLARIEAHIDFPDEEIDEMSIEEVRRELLDLIQMVGDWISTYEEGSIFREGISCAIIGKTNVGKSSLLNVLMNQDRAIVTPIPGTTRDVIEEVLNIQGIPVRLMDTAGLRKTRDSIEQEGVLRAKEKAATADLILLVLDGSQPLEPDDFEIAAEIEGKKKVVVLNKRDLPMRVSMEALKNRFPHDPIVSISALKKEGIEDLKRTVFDLMVRRGVRATPEHLIIANLRHKKILLEVKESLLRAVKGLEEGVSFEFIALEIRSALLSLGEMVGETTPEDVLNRIFEQFCIGK
ncbi:MAG: tRNA uridine-5-carboxymethylaminomethyl(34) synthesis GTPase MnmE [Desulfobacterota bacterium]|nr:tRNA uridine-5-carboxymethylaminomethyl(34) synthesis GTPase MnmE [Thermodesulfobacteriota bacterium]